MSMVVINVLCLVVGTAAGGPARADVAIRFYDYVRLRPELLARAQELVREIYRDIDVNIRWADTVRPSDSTSTSAPIVDGGELVVNVVDDAMARSLGLAAGIVGTAAVSAEAPGRIAYVVFGRVRRAALQSGTSVGEMLALVVAHELGHLLLPQGSHSASGVMRAQWDLDDLRRDSGRFTFTPMQADTIRQRVQHVHDAK